MSRQPSQIICNDTELYALCQDGSVWRIRQGESWQKLPDIPDDPGVFSKPLTTPPTKVASNAGLSNEAVRNEFEPFECPQCHNYTLTSIPCKTPNWERFKCDTCGYDEFERVEKYASRSQSS